MSLFQHDCDDKSFSHVHQLLHAILHNQELQMAQIDDLNALVTSLQGDVSGISADVTEVLTMLKTAQGNPTGPSLTDAITKLTAVDTALKTADASLKAVEPAPPVPNP